MSAAVALVVAVVLCLGIASQICLASAGAEANASGALHVCSKFTSMPELVNQTERLLKPFYLHVPKCGSTFAAVITEVHCPWVKLEPPVLRPPSDKQCKKATTRFMGGHSGLVERHTSSGVTILRDPVERVVSGFMHNFHWCPHIGKRYLGDGFSFARPAIHSREFWKDKVGNLTLVREYAECTRGMATLMLNGLDRRTQPFRRPTASETRHAVQTILSFAFVGLQEEWDETVCLYRAMFGGHNMSSLPFASARKSPLPGLKGQVRESLRAIDWLDEDEWLVYDAARNRFKQDKKRYLSGGDGTSPQ